MSNIKLYMAPGTCARVASIALEEAGQDFEVVVIRFMRGEHKSPQFKKFNPQGKVPALVIGGEALTENVAIISYLNERYPDARLMPTASDALTRARQLADLCFCASTLHPLVTRIRMPQLFAAADAVQSVWEKGCAGMVEYFDLIEGRLADGPWWYGDDWSAMDAYLYWVFWRVEGADFDVSAFPRFKQHSVRMQMRPAVQRAWAREKAAEVVLESEGLNFKPPPRS